LGLLLGGLGIGFVGDSDGLDESGEDRGGHEAGNP
jgi:hypothetical protein